MFNDFINLIFPPLCSSCNNVLLKNEPIICTSCHVQLPKTNYHLDKENPISKIFWGRIQIEMAASFYFFKKKSNVQNLLHQLKYNNNTTACFYVGKLYGLELKESIHFKNINYILPVPLHKNKLKQRGYNQSEWIANGIAEILQIPVLNNVLYRTTDTATQTKKKRYKRWENVAETFKVDNVNLISGKNILLVDDVITTGATLESCAKMLTPHHCKVYIATISCA